MNRRPPGLNLCEAIEGFTKYKVVEGLSERTLDSFLGYLAKLVDRTGDVPLTDLETQDIEDFFYWLRAEYRPDRLSGRTSPLSDKSIYNIGVTLKSFFTWAKKRRFVDHNPMVAIPRPKFQEKPVEPFSRQEIERLLWACKYSLVAKTKGRRPFNMERPSYQRDKALTMFLLDTGLRASELCVLRVGDVDMKSGEVTVRHGKEGGAKGAKGRTVFIGMSPFHRDCRTDCSREIGAPRSSGTPKEKT